MDEGKEFASENINIDSSEANSFWYPGNKNELNNLLDFLLLQKSGKKIKEIHGVIVPHAGFAYSGEVAGAAYGLLKNKKIKKAIVFGPSHYAAFRGLASLSSMKTPLGDMKIKENFYQKLPKEHSVKNQIPFLQKLNKDMEIMPLVVGDISVKEAEEIAKQFANEKDALFVFSTDLSHFFPYEEAVKKDRKTISIITDLNLKQASRMDACGHFPLLIAMQLCKLKKWKPELIEYKNSGDVTGDKESVVGYASFVF